MHEKAKAYAQDVVAKADAGDKEAKKKLFLDRVTRKAIKPAEVQATMAKLDLSADERKTVEAALPNLEMSQITARMWQDRPAGARKLAAMLEAGRIPTGREAGSFFSLVMGAAVESKDKKLADKTLTAAKAAAEKDASLERMISNLEKQAAKIEDAK